ncbi:hypothetical protein FRC18_005578 [Serendipita sp. 400]|nr:hypothetical protein FRC18_005578 [Serendipita sp. 400]
MWDYYAQNIIGLAEALGYIQGANFELHMTLNKSLFLHKENVEEEKKEKEEVVPWDRFRTQCTSLIISNAYNPFNPFLPFVEHLPALENLNSPSVAGNSATVWSIMQHIPSNPSRLRSLALTLDLDLGEIFNADTYPHTRRILKRLRRFRNTRSLSASSLKALAASFEDLEELVLSDELDPPELDLDQIRQTVGWNVQPKALEISIAMLPMFPNSFLRGLTELSLYDLSDYEVIRVEDPKLDLPRLTSLSLDYSRSGLFLFEAPNLKDLHLSFNKWDYRRLHPGPSLRPILVEIKDWETSMAAFLSNPPFPDINELHVHTYPCSSDKISKLLLTSLSRQPPLLPNLQHLLVITYFLQPDELEKFKQELLVATNSCNRLISVRCTVHSDR